MRVSFYTCDVFTNRKFAGNPLLVVPDARGLTHGQMQSIAWEINYSESTFVLPPGNAKHAYRQRTFVPCKEIPYAGHPTIGTAFVLASLGLLPAPDGDAPRRITIEVGFGPLELELIPENGTVGRVRMSQGTPTWQQPIEDPATLNRIARSMGLDVSALHPRHLPRVVSTGNRILIVPLRDVSMLPAAAADPKQIIALENEFEVLVVYPFAEGRDSRCRARGFCSGTGTLEDPATGSAAGPLGIYLALEKILPRERQFLVDQGIEMGRPSEIEVSVLLDREGEEPTGVRVAGTAVRVMDGTIEV